MFAVSFYEMAPGAMARVMEVYPRHRAYLDEFARGGDVVLIGTFADPEADGSMAVFRTRDAAERFCAGDPFVTEGLVGAHRILDWNALDFT